MSNIAHTLEAIIVPPTNPATSSVIWLHGLGADGHDFVNIIPQLNLPPTLSTRFIFPHAPIRPVSINGGMPMRAWFDIHGLSFESRIDLAGLQAANQAISQLIAQELALGIPAEKIVLAGFSQGGALALYAGLQYPKRLAGIMGLSTFLSPDHPKREAFSPANFDLPILMAHGTYDPIVSLNMGEAAKNHLVDAGFEVEWHTYPMAHAVCEAEIIDISAWLRKVLG